MAKVRAGTPPADTESVLPSALRVVGIGASAGGLEALQEFLGPLKAGTGTAFIVAQHLSPDHPSLIVELLGRATSLTVVEAVDGALLEPDVVAVAPPNRDVSVEGDRLRLVEPPARMSPSPSIDVLFESLAGAWGSNTLVIVLSGTGSDGAHGVRSVRGAGGLTMVQAPETARFDGMPRAAIGLGSVDLVADAVSLGQKVAALVQGQTGWLDIGLPVADGDMLPVVTAELKRSIGIDFTQYKESTLRRQIQRRMAIRQLTGIDDYVALLVEDTAEAHALSRNLLVTVTSFFRDPDAFEALAEALGDYLARQDPGEPLRVWVPGCATGEEAYSVGMVLAEALGHPANLRRSLKIFGTDLDETSLGFARRAVYPAAAAAQIPAHLRALYTKESVDGFQISEVLRECTVFARHDVGTDPPFPRIDLVSCRNTLIYFTAPLQDRVIGLFGLALRPGGLLFLGSAENVDRDSLEFQTVDVDSRVFRRSLEPAARNVPSAVAPVDRGDRLPLSAPRAPFLPESGLKAQVALLEELVRVGGRAMLVLDEDRRLLQVVGDVSPFCRVAEGRVTGLVVDMLTPELQEEARALLLLTRGGGEPVVGQSIPIAALDGSVHLVVQRLHSGNSAYTVVTFEIDDDRQEAAAAHAGERSGAFDRELKRLEGELVASQDTLRRSLMELEAVNEELEASSEELQASSEELQASNEELQASNEELQATNEELGTLNRELGERGDDLQDLNIDLENIQASLSQGMVIVNRELQVTRFTPLAVRVFALLDADIGRPLLAAPTTLDIPGFESALRAVVAGAPRQTIEAGDVTVSYLVQILPYRAPDGRRLGAIVTLTDVTEMVALRTTAKEAFVELQDKSDLLAHQATFDSVTGLINRGFFADLLANELSRASRSSGQVALAWLDLDKFKEINDEFGHETGDVTLQVVGQRVLDNVRESDRVGRLGGDEMGLIVAGYGSLAELDIILERIVVAVREPIDVDGHELIVTTSMGVALFPQDATSPKDLMRAADAAMYAVKRQVGDGHAYFDTSMNDAAGARRAKRLAIASGMAHSEFEMHYQPVVSASSDAVWGVEALVRWRHDGELVPAADFIPFCEESGQIRALGLHTVDLLRGDLAVLRAQGHRDLKVAFNMSVTQLEDRNFIDVIDAIDGADGLRGIVVEILESVFLPDHAQAMEVLDTLVRLGAELSIDDYGSGYSNIRLLESLDPAYIKLDRSFLSEHHSVESRRALIRSAVEISHVVGATVIAEGIESEEQRRLVRDAGADFVQGYGIARPMPLDQLLAWLSVQTPSPVRP